LESENKKKEKERVAGRQKCMLRNNGQKISKFDEN
jgi:hypothetical protein